MPPLFAFYAEAIDKVYGEIAPTGADDLALVAASQSAWWGPSCPGTTP